jgi:hypothetical protein
MGQECMEDSILALPFSLPQPSLYPSYFPSLSPPHACSLSSPPQVEDRRSAVNKQACATLALLSTIYGLKFQDHAIYFLPVLFKVLPITVLVSRELTVLVSISPCQSLNIGWSI